MAKFKRFIGLGVNNLTMDKQQNTIGESIEEMVG